MVFLIKLFVTFISLGVFSKLVRQAFVLKTEKEISKHSKLALFFTGFIANVADTLGIGSFAVVVACNNHWKFVDDKKLPGTLNAHSLLPALLQSLLFLNFVEMDLVLLFSFVLAACFGGLVSGFLVSKMDKQSVRLLMIFGFLAISFLLFFNQLELLPIAGEETSLQGVKLFVGIFLMMFAGALPAIGVGLYVPIQVILFLLGLSPLVAYPIMTTAGVIVQSTTALAFIAKREVSIKKSLLLNLAGLIGVGVAVPLITYVHSSTLRWLLLLIVIYNAILLIRSYRKEKLRPLEI